LKTSLSNSISMTRIVRRKRKRRSQIKRKIISMESQIKVRKRIRK
jgi:hypothetical protein